MEGDENKLLQSKPSSTKDEKLKKKKKIYEEKFDIKKSSTNEVINEKQKNICDAIDTTHTKMTYNSEIYKCDVCGKLRKSYSSLNKHKAKFHILNGDTVITTYISKHLGDEENSLMLNTQVKKIKNKAKVKVKTVTVKEKTISDVPKENSNSVFSSTVHTNESQTSKFYKCNICRISFEFLSALDEHKTNCHVTYVAPYICKFCDEPFENANSLSIHQCINTRKSLLECEICNKTYSTSSVLRNHYKVHIGKRAYTCDVCSRPFMWKGDLTTHYRIHTDEKPYVCDVCNSAFMRKGDLTKHYRIHTGERPYNCDVCRKTFSVSITLTNHYRVHTGERPYTCDVCGKSFAEKGTLTKHYRIHTGEKPYECGICYKAFARCSNRTNHIRVKHNNCF